MANLQVVVIDNEAQEPFEQRLGFQFGQSIDVLYMVADGEDRLPACNGVGPDYRMDGFEDFTNILGCAAGLRVDFKPVLGGSFVEFGLRVGGGQRFEELLVGL
jgi:hypothetical protein